MIILSFERIAEAIIAAPTLIDFAPSNISS